MYEVDLKQNDVSLQTKTSNRRHLVCVFGKEKSNIELGLKKAKAAAEVRHTEGFLGMAVGRRG